MAEDGKRTHREVVTHADQIGKVFKVVSQDMRQCLICDQLFTRQASAEHADVVCYPTISDAWLLRCIWNDNTKLA